MDKFTGVWWETVTEKAWQLYLNNNYRKISYKFYCWCIIRRNIAFDRENGLNL